MVWPDDGVGRFKNQTSLGMFYFKNIPLKKKTYLEKDLSKLVQETFLHRDHSKRTISKEQQIAAQYYRPK